MKKVIYYLSAAVLLVSMATTSLMASVPQPLNDLENVDLECKFLNRCQCRKIFKTRRVGRNFDVVKVKLTNNGTNKVCFDKDVFSRSAANAGDVFHSCRYNPTARATTWGLVSLVTPFIISIAAGVADTACAVKNNRNMGRRFHRLEVDQGEVLPGETREGFLFFDKMNRGEHLVVNLEDKETHQSCEWRFRR